MSDLFAGLPGLQSFINFGSSWGFMESLLNGEVFWNLMARNFQNQFFIYAGALISLTMSWVSAAWVIVNGTQAVAAFTGNFKEGYYATYAGASGIGNNLGLYELISFLLYAVWSLSVTLGSLYITSRTWTMTDARVEG